MYFWIVAAKNGLLLGSDNTAHSIISILLRKLLQSHDLELMGPTRFLVLCPAFVFCCQPCARCEIRREKVPYIILISAAFDVP